MISPEILRRFPFFSALDPEQLKAIAMISEVVEIHQGERLFEECQSAEYFYLLMDGSIDLVILSEGTGQSKTRREFHVGEINPGEVFAISALIEPYQFSATGNVSQNGSIIKINASSLRALLEKDNHLGYHLMAHVAKAAMERLLATRVQLAAAWA